MSNFSLHVRDDGSRNEMPCQQLPVATNPGAHVLVGAGQRVDAWGDAQQLASLGAALELARQRRIGAGEEDFG